MNIAWIALALVTVVQPDPAPNANEDEDFDAVLRAVETSTRDLESAAEGALTLSICQAAAVSDNPSQLIEERVEREPTLRLAEVLDRCLYYTEGRLDEAREQEEGESRQLSREPETEDWEFTS